MDEFKEYHDYMNWLQDIPDDLTYDEVWNALDARIPHLKRHNATHRVFEESGINKLLDQMNKILLTQCVELLENEANV